MKIVEGERIYLEENTAEGRSLGYLMVSTISSAAVAVMLAVALLVVWHSSGQRYASIVRIEPDGRTEPVVEGVHFHRQPQEVNWFLQRFCEQYFSRASFAAETLRNTKYYFDPNVMPSVEEAWKQAQVFENMASAGASGLMVHAVAGTPQLSLSGHEAYVQIRLEKRFPGQTSKEQTLTSTSIRFRCLACDGQPIPDAIAAVNPLGFQIENVPLLEAAK